MKNFITQCLLFIAFLTLSQGAEAQYHRSLSWNRPYQIAIGDTSITMVSFEGSVSLDNTYVPEYQEFFDVPQGSQLVGVAITNLVFQPFDKAISKTFEGVKSIGDSIVVTFLNIPNRRVPRALVSFVPIKNGIQPGSHDRIMSFDLQLSFSPKAENQSHTQARVYADVSLLATGRWFKYSIKESGVHKITFDGLKSAGLDPATINPQHIRMFSYGGAMLPESNLVQRYDDLAENAMMLVGEEDGVFNTQDYILFYGENPHKWTYFPGTRTFDFQPHLYSDLTYFFLTADKGVGKRIAVQPSSSLPAHLAVETFDDLQVYEKDEINLIKSGREWYGEVFEAVTLREFNFTIPNLLTDSVIRFKASLAARSFVGSSFSLDVNGTAITMPISGVSSTNPYSDYAIVSTVTRNLISSTGQIKVRITYNRSASPSTGWLNRITLHSKRSLLMTGDQMTFRSVSSIGQGLISEFKLSNAPSTINIWDVTDGRNVMKQHSNMDGSAQRFRILTDQLRQFIAFDPAKTLKPIFVEKVVNQNLHAMTPPELIIVTHPLFLDEARRLATFHTNHSGLVVEIATTPQIYNEFSAGCNDLTAIRDFVKMLFDRAEESSPLKYLLLFGDASYDYKDKVKDNTNYVPCWQSNNSLNASDTYASDDYFGYLEDHEGTLSTDNLDIGIGRIPVSTPEQAVHMVNKIIRYATPSAKNHGDWRNIICLVADDEDTNEHMSQADKLAALINTKNSAFNIDKVYFDAYQQVHTSGGQRYPQVNEAINNRVDKGALIVNYIGHGGTKGWGHERALELADINAWTNSDKLPLFITATCEFAYFDDPQVVSAGELVLLNPSGGGIALYTTARPTYSSENFILNQRVYQNIFEQENNQYKRLGDVMRLAKQNTTSVNARKFILLGDPAIRLAAPNYKVETTHINEVPILSSADTLKALAYVTFKGKITNQTGNLLENFNGEVVPVVFDKSLNVTTLANDGGATFSFDLQRNILYKGKSSVKNGLFEFSFMVPKDIAYQYGKGKISYYASDGIRDAHGSNNNVMIGGFNQNAGVDLKGPEVRLYINDENFRSGGTTHENPLLYAVISDESGINTTGTGIGHDIIAVLNEQTDKVKVLNDYYVADLDTYKKGRISYPFFNLADGRYSLRLKVWDIYNNSSEAVTEFVVAGSVRIALDKVINYPNPFNDHTRFVLEHNQAGSEMEVQVQIYSFDGRLCKVLTDKLVPVGYRSEIFTWDGTDDGGAPLGGGIYVYKTIVTVEGKKTADLSS
ncbi:MAG: type IX secretion system sortase PorU, partial [Bacteroidales bacterium]|nr:type IX secretion system sortase PorU [Bacteroidales bacterium]